MLIRPRLIAVLTVMLALSSVGGASAMTKAKVSTAAGHAKVVKKVTAAAKSTSAARTKGAGTIIKPVSTGTATAAIGAYPTGGKGSGTEATCALWTKRLQEDQQIIDNAPETDKDDASGPLNEDVDNALDAGCFVIY
jgi:hypothetical protein